MKKLLFLFSLCALMVSPAFSQNDNYYTGDESTVTEKTNEAPPVLPEYTQPPCPEEGYLWTPGYWAWGTEGYYWVAGVWVHAPAADMVWTPGYWSHYNGYYGWHAGYWSNHIGYYGGINYGYGYTGFSFFGGKWKDGVFQYNTNIWTVNTDKIHHTYVGDEIHKPVENHASFNGPGGITYRPMANEEAALKEKHNGATIEQLAHIDAALHDKRQYNHNNEGKPAYHSMNKPGGQYFDEHGNAIHVGKMKENKPRR